MSRAVLNASAIAAMVVPALAQAPLGTAITYQGRLVENGQPADGAYDLRFRLFDAAAGGSQLGATLDRHDVPVTAGLFTAALDFGSGAWDGNARWLEVHVRPGASTGAYTPLLPRQPVTAAPYALYALNGPGGSGGYWSANGSAISNTNAGFVGIRRTTPVTGAEYFGIQAPVESGYGGMYIQTDGSAGMPFYGYRAGSGGTAWTYLHGGTGDWRLYNLGDRVTVKQLGDVGIGTTNPNGKLHVVGNGSASVLRLSNGGSCASMTNTALTIGDVCGSGRAASLYGVTSSDLLKVQNDGAGKAAEFVGDVAVTAGKIGVGTGAPVAPVHITSGTDTAPAGGGYIVNGPVNGLNVSIDNNEIMARNNGSVSTLYLNAHGGDVSMGQYGIHPALAYGRIRGATATIIGASANVLGVTRLNAGSYEVEIAGGLSSTDVPIAHGTDYFNRVGSYVSGGKLYVFIENGFDGIFVFVIYRP